MTTETRSYDPAAEGFRAAEGETEAQRFARLVGQAEAEVTDRRKRIEDHGRAAAAYRAEIDGRLAGLRRSLGKPGELEPAGRTFAEPTGPAILEGGR